MSLLDSLLQSSKVSRIIQKERLEKGVVIEGDFDGSVTGYWVRLQENGGGVVSYNKKEYITKPIGFTSYPLALKWS